MASIFQTGSEQRRDLRDRMRRLGIREEDLQERFLRSRGPGGQKVNKAATAVRLVHRPTGISVRCETERSLALNRQIARQLLCDRLERRLAELRRAEQQVCEKRRRQTRTRTPAQKERMLAFKRARSLKKAARARPVQED